MQMVELEGLNRRKEHAMAETFAAFLRGINVSGNKIKMDDLKEAFAGMGFTGARTVLNTGNVVFMAEQSMQEVKPLIENRLKVTLGYDAPVYLRSVSELETLQDVTRTLSVPEDCHLYLLLCDSAALPKELDMLFTTTPHSENEQFHPAAGDAFWIVPKGQTLSSPFGAKVLGAKRHQNRLTSRNWNTIEKVLALMQKN
ncbi:DUF1697 domain-containing protein [Caproicibacter fermentans]|uniref:DUF1697 domain-containing protein n=1 Tax=Caproicibacter fermentans TaxID=2576756 RepID=A0A7G8T897_9FIRM|nr:DUF1697 domain-containing protein [Caproicibacter fermentans]QNK39838.1 DUF1697 domain-containing protein [Caproicibacter fermentans]